jgi:bifunctional DNA-binding transcriptional regulator/antitoxin component of YhaV-PrlF toxin-antitoxin module
MGYMSKLQVISRKNNTEQYYLICPAALGKAMELARGESIEWVIEDKNTIILKRKPKHKKHIRRNKK